MDKIFVKGGHRLKGSVKISGSKNASLPILVSALLPNGESTFFNVPRLNDVFNILILLENLGVKVNFKKNVVKIDSSNLNFYGAPRELACEIRASILILGPLVAKLKRAVVPLPGGCPIGARPIDLHIKGLQQLGANVKVEKDCVIAFTKGLKGADIRFNIKTVTGTENLIMASVLADGITILRNIACEPEVIALSNVLNMMGAKIQIFKESKIVIKGVRRLHPIKYSIIPDRIEAGTFMIASALTNGDVKIINCKPKTLTSVINKVKLVGANVVIIGDDIHVKGNNKIFSIDLKTKPYPGFPTDLQALFMVLMTVSNGLSMICENLFENRFIHVKELIRMGANIKISGNVAIIKGVKSLYGTNVLASDLRGSASLILAGLVANGTTEITGINHLDRGYEFLEKKIKNLGGIIHRIK